MNSKSTSRSLRVASLSTALLFGGLVAVNFATWIWAFARFAGSPAAMATALLTWVLGLRHAVDADHIAAIDNSVRKLIQAGDTPKCAGLYFALGHSTVVVIATLLLSQTAIRVVNDDSPIRTIGGLIGTSVSATFLLLIALINLAILISQWRTVRTLRRPPSLQMEDLDAILAGRGVLAQLLSPMFRIVTKTWHMYPLGLLFGLGFDTAAAIGLISLSAAETAHGVSLWSVLVFPALFTAGMALLDTADGLLMVNTYCWAFVDPQRKLWYNLTITAVSVVVALFIGGVETFGFIGKQLGLFDHGWSTVADLNERLSDLGFVIIGLFGLLWLVSAALYQAALKRRACRK